jgi:hypothetical protein
MLAVDVPGSGVDGLLQHAMGEDQADIVLDRGAPEKPDEAAALEIAVEAPPEVRQPLEKRGDQDRQHEAHGNVGLALAVELIGPDQIAERRAGEQDEAGEQQPSERRKRLRMNDPACHGSRGGVGNR